MNSSIIETLDLWVEDRCQRLAAKGKTIWMTCGPVDRTPRAAQVDFESATRAARLTVWAGGRADLAILDYEKGQELLDEIARSLAGQVLAALS